MYGRTVGEVDTLLYYLHCVWAEITEKTGQFNDIRAIEMEKVSEHPALGFTTDAERVQLIPEGGKVALTRIIDYWKAVDLGLFNH